MTREPLESASPRLSCSPDPPARARIRFQAGLVRVLLCCREPLNECQRAKYQIAPGQANLKNAPPPPPRLPHLHSKRSSLAPAGEIRLDKQRLFLLYSRHIDVMNTIKIVSIRHPWRNQWTRIQTRLRWTYADCQPFRIGLMSRLIIISRVSVHFNIYLYLFFRKSERRQSRPKQYRAS